MEAERKTETSEAEATPDAAAKETPDRPCPGEAPTVSEADAKPEEIVGPAADLRW